MQKFTRALTREIEVGGERLAVTLSEQGLSVRPVGSRRPPHEMTWAQCLCALTGHPAPADDGDAEALTEALQVLRGAAGRRTSAQEPATTADSPLAHTVADSPVALATPPNAPDKLPLPALLRRLDDWLAVHRPRFHVALRPGADPAELEVLTDRLGATLPGDLRTWLSWHNGQSDEVFGAFEEGWNLMSTGQIADARNELNAEPHEGWQTTWIPFLDNDRGDYLILDPNQPGPPVRACWQGRSEHALVAPSLRAWVEDFVAALERGAYHEDPERGTFDRD